MAGAHCYSALRGLQYANAYGSKGMSNRVLLQSATEKDDTLALHFENLNHPCQKLPRLELGGRGRLGNDVSSEPTGSIPRSGGAPVCTAGQHCDIQLRQKQVDRCGNQVKVLDKDVTLRLYSHSAPKREVKVKEAV